MDAAGHGRPTLSVVVPVVGDDPPMRAALAALGRADPPPDEVVVVVDGGDAAAAATARTHADHVLTTPARLGPAAARNLGARHARGDLLLFVDADVVVHRATVDRARRLFVDDPGLDAAIGAYDADPPAAGALSQYKNLLNHWMHHRAGPHGETFWGACGVIRRTTFLALGGFDAERYPVPSVEDIDLGYRLTARGGRIRVAPELAVTHLKRWTARSLLVTDVTRRAVPWAHLLLERGRLQNDLNVDLAGRAKVASAWTGLLAAAAAVGGATGAGVVALVAVALLAVLDGPFLAFLWRRRGPRVAAVGALWHWWSHLYGGAAFAWVAAGRLLHGRGVRARPEPEPLAPATAVGT